MPATTIQAPCTKMLNRKRPPVALNRSLFAGLHGDGRRLITGWLKKADESWRSGGADAFESFIFCWIAFNGWGACVANTEVDREWVEAVAFDAELGRRFGELASADGDFYRVATVFRSYFPIFKANELRDQRLRLAIERVPRRDLVESYFRQGRTKYEPQCFQDHQAQVPLDWSHSMLALYRVRNNLFHGEKARHSEMDADIVNAAYEVLFGFITRTGLLT